MSEVTNTRIDYMITFVDSSIQVDVSTYPNLLTIGEWMEDKGNHLRVITSMEKEEIIQILAEELQIKDTAIIMSASSLVFPITCM